MSQGYSLEKDCPLSIDQADECYRSALRRVAVYLNYGKGRLCSESWLKLSDSQLRLLFVEKKLDHQLINYLVSIPPEGTTGANRAPNDVRAEHEFYGSFRIENRRSPNRSHITFRSSEVFREWSLLRLHRPEFELKSVQDQFDADSDSAFSEAFTNYLVKNFWHNMVHLQMQRINDLNFHEFGGEARDQSDFVADNIANILLLRSYGHKPKVKGKLAVKTAGEYERIFAMNRCNRVFAERAIRRKETQSVEEAFSEQKWRFQRQVANTLSAHLLIKGAGVSDIAVYFNGKTSPRGKDRGGFYHQGEVIIRLNQAYFNTGLPPYLEDANQPGLQKDRVKAIRANYSRRIQEVVGVASSNYVTYLQRSEGTRMYAEDSLRSMEHRLQFG